MVSLTEYVDAAVYVVGGMLRASSVRAVGWSSAVGRSAADLPVGRTDTVPFTDATEYRDSAGASESSAVTRMSRPPMSSTRPRSPNSALCPARNAVPSAGETVPVVAGPPPDIDAVDADADADADASSVEAVSTAPHSPAAARLRVRPTREMDIRYPL